MNANIYHSIDLITQELNDWAPEEIFIDSQDGSKVNLVHFIGGGGTVKKDTWCLLPVDENTNNKEDPTHRINIVETLASACAEAGFSICSAGWDSRVDRINVACIRGKLHEPVPSKKGIRKTTTNRPTCKEDLCPFRFNIHWHEEKRCWGIKAGYGSIRHLGHRKLNPEHIKRIGTRALPQLEYDFCMESLRCNNSPASVQAFAKRRCNVTLSTTQIEYWQKLLKGNPEENGTAAMQLVQLLENAKDISYVVLYDDPSSDLLKVRKPRRNEANSTLSLHCTLHRSNGTEETVISECAPPEMQSAIDYVERVRRSMSLDNGQKMLLAAAWCSDDDRRLFELFPEVIAADITEQTNSEKRPLMLLAGLTGNKETFTFCQAFLPSQQRWVFDWFFGKAVPLLFPEDILTRNRMMLTDGDEKEYNSFLSFDEIYPNSKHHLCTWHLLDRGLKRSGIPGLCSQHNMCAEGCSYFEVVKIWIKSWFTKIETENEFDDSFRKLHLWLQSEEVTHAMGLHVVNLIIDFINNTLLPHKNKWLFARFLHVRTLGRQSTQIVEVENSVLKRSSNGPKPNHPINKAACSMMIVQDIRNSNKVKKSANALNTRSTSAFPNNIDGALNDYCVQEIMSQCNAGRFYDVFRKSETVFLVKRQSILDADIEQQAAEREENIHSWYPGQILHLHEAIPYISSFCLR